jgi:hypothetical protein
MNSNKALVKAFSLKPKKLDEVGQVIDLSKYGEFSRFIQEAVDEKLDRIFAERNPQPENELKAS